MRQKHTRTHTHTHTCTFIVVSFDRVPNGLHDPIADLQVKGKHHAFLITIQGVCVTFKHDR